MWLQTPICISSLCPERHHHAEWGTSASPACFTPKIVSGSASVSEEVMMLRCKNRAGKEACRPPRGPGKSKEVPGAWVGDTVTPNWLWALQRGEGRSIKNDHMWRAARPAGQCFIILWAVGAIGIPILQIKLRPKKVIL